MATHEWANLHRGVHRHLQRIVGQRLTVALKRLPINQRHIERQHFLVLAPIVILRDPAHNAAEGPFYNIHQLFFHQLHLSHGFGSVLRSRIS